MLGCEGLDSVIIAGSCGEDFLKLLTTRDIGRTVLWQSGEDSSRKKCVNGVWNINLNRYIGKRKTWLMKLSVHDLLGQLSAVRRTLNAQGRVEVVGNTIMRNVMLHLIWKLNRKPSKS